MVGARQTLRLFRIVQILVRHGLDEFITVLHLFRPYRALLYLFPGFWFRNLDKPRGQRLREALEELGPIFVKFGQLLSTRPDLIPEDIASELTRLQDRVAPFPGKTARAVIELSYDGPVETHLAEFEDQPMAAASVAQVHRARLLDGTKVVVKVLRPGIEVAIDRDLAVLHALAYMADRHWSDAKRLRPVEVVEDYDKTIHDELDLMREAANAAQLRHNFLDSDLIYVPQVYWEHCRRDVMVMEQIGGIPIRDVDAIRKAGVDMKQLAHNGVEIFFTQAFRDGFFHADMHPGNIFVGPDGQYRAVDFGIMGTLSEQDKRYLAENLLGFFNRDYRAVARAHLRAGWVPADTRADEFESAVRTVCEPIFAKPISEISFGRLVIRLFQVARRFNMPVQPQLVLLQKTLLNIEGLGRQLYPELDLWETAKPFLERWMREQIGPQALFNTVRQELPHIAALLPQLPGLTQDLLQRFQDDESHSKARTREIEALNCRIDRSERRLTGVLLGSAVGLSGVLILLFGSETLGSMAAAQGVGTGLCLFGVIVGLYSWLATARRP
jgi:ubiquinone biosynthesis protein